MKYTNIVSLKTDAPRLSNARQRMNPNQAE
jgi:hypothetical protein